MQFSFKQEKCLNSYNLASNNKDKYADESLKRKSLTSVISTNHLSI